MKKIILFLIIQLLLVLQIKAQPYEISFSGSGSSSTVDSVTAYNMNQNTTVYLGGNDVLVLDVLVGSDELILSSDKLLIYPNPFESFCFIEFEVNEISNADIEVYDSKGALIIKSTYSVSAGHQRFRLNNLPQGLLFITVATKDNFYCGKILSTKKSEALPGISFEHLIVKKKSFLNHSIDENISSETSGKTFSYVHMIYNSGERLLLTGKSGVYATIISLVPANSQTVNFRFVPCTDAEGNNYPVVHIGSQTWMATNLKTAHYHNGDSIPQITDDTEWLGLTTGAYCYYNNSASNLNSFGRLYNWYAITDERAITPNGWRIPMIDDFNCLANYVGLSTFTGKLKEYGFNHWLSPNLDATNEYGFTALPAGARTNGVFSNPGNRSALWTKDAYGLYLRYNASDWYAVLYDWNKACGFSIRCILGELPEMTLDSISDITSNSTRVFGRVTNEGSSPVTEKGFCWHTQPETPNYNNTHINCGSGLGPFSYNITGLIQDGDYYVRAYAISAVDTVYSNVGAIHTDYGLPFIHLDSIFNITGNSASAACSIDTTGGFTSETHGVCWNEVGWPTIQDDHTVDGSGTGNYISNINGLIPGHHYQVRAYSTNYCGTVYGGYEVFNTNPVLPTLTTAEISGYTFPEPVSGGIITDDGGSPVTERGLCWSHTNYPPTINDDHIASGSGTGTYACTITSGISNNTHYWVRAYATNSVGTAYGNIVDLNTTLVIGQPYQGGIIVYFSDPSHGLIAAPQDTGPNDYPNWGCWEGTCITTSFAYGSGQSNTNAIVAGCPSPGIAAQLCNDFVLNGYSDWFLPSKAELAILYNNKDLFGNFYNCSYWSSSQSENNCIEAWVQDFTNSTQACINKFNFCRIRPVRYF